MAQAIWDDKYIDVVDVDTTQWDMYSGSTNTVGQSFTSQGGILRRAAFYLGKDGSPTGNVVARLRTHSGTYGTNSLPTGAVLATSEGVVASSLSTIRGWVNFDFTDEYELQDGTNYCIEVYYADGDDVNVVQAAARVTGSHDGNCYSNSTAAGYDMYFAVITSSSSEYLFEISSWEELAAINDSKLYLIQDYKLTTDLDSSSTGYDTYASSSANSGEGWIPIGTAVTTAFKGSLFDGGGHSISDIYISNSSWYSGLFGSILGSSGSNRTIIRDIRLLNINIEQGTNYVGGLVGSASNTNIVRCETSGIINGDVYVGGVVGRIYTTGNIQECFSSCNIIADDYLGGLAGLIEAYLSDVENCFSTGSVIENQEYQDGNYIGGLIGRVSFGTSTVSKCYSTGLVEAGTYNTVGGLIGSDYTTEYSFWDTQTSGMATSDGGTGKTTVEMQDIDTFTNWSIQKYSMIPSSTWYIKEGEEYPQLTWTLPTVKVAQTPYYSGQGEKKYSVKVYDRAGSTFKGGYDPIGGYSFNKVVNGGVGDLTIELPRKFDQYGLGDDVNLLDEIQIWVQDKDTSGKRLYSGYVSGITSYVNGISQGIRLDVLGYASRFGFTLDTDGSSVGVVRNSMTPGEIAKDVIDKYRTTVSEERINYGASTVDITGTDISYTSNTKSCLETIERAREMAGSTWYWYVDADNIFYFKEYSTTPDHLFVFGKDVSSLEITRNADNIKNELIFWNGLQSGEANFLSKRYYNTDSIAGYWNRFEKLTDSRIVDSTTADSLGSSFINAYKEPNVSMKFEVKDGNLGQGYDIESIEPGQTCKILNLDDSSVVGDNMVITSVRYTPESATVYVSDLREITGRSLTNLRRQLDNTVYGDRPSNLTDSEVV